MPDVGHTHLIAAAVMLLACQLAPAADGAGAKERKAPVESVSRSAEEQQPEGAKSIEELTSAVRDSVVVISFEGRNGRRQGMGTGFVISSEGLVATNLHVIGEARAIEVRSADGSKHDVESIYASDRTMDLAILKIDADGLPTLPLGDSDALRQGESVVTVGNPEGLTHSVVNGIVSGRREIDGRPMIQLAMPIEQGNSGGPLLDMQGRVHGILTLKSIVTENLGFAVAINALKPLLEKPNPVRMARWLTIGKLDEQDWTALFGARWRQRAGRISVEGRGNGFGGRALALSSLEPPARPYEVAVSVRLNDESGAAGLVFLSDGKHKHYGFYPSNGKLRLSRFDGPDVYSWRVLEEVHSRHYTKGEWNHLKVRLEEDKILCYVNDELVIESIDAVYTEGQAGLATFRETAAEFKGFDVAREIPPIKPPPELAEKINGLVAGIPVHRPPQQGLIDRIGPDSTNAGIVLRAEARLLEQRAERLRQLARAVHEQQVRNELEDVLNKASQDVDLLRAALLVARMDNEEIDVDAYLREVDDMSAEVAAAVDKTADEKSKLAALDRYLFEELGFHGSRTDYYNRSNSYVNELIDDREGLPITLSVLYMEIARRLDIEVLGVGLPGHFVVRRAAEERDGELIDVFNRAARMSVEEAGEKVRLATGRPLEEEHLAAQSKRAIIARMLMNLFGAARDQGDTEGMLRYIDTAVAINPNATFERWYRAVLNYQTGRIEESIRDTEWLLDRRPASDAVDLEQVRQLHRILEHSRQDASNR